MELRILEELFSVCKVRDYLQVDFGEPFIFAGSTDDEKSLVCPTRLAPVNTVERSDGWRAFRIEGVLDFSLIGILASISNILAKEGIGIFAVSTFNTDYILTKAEQFEAALHSLELSGYVIR